MLVDAPDVPPTVLNVQRFYGKAAVAQALRAPPTGDTPGLAGIYVLLPGLDADADEAAIRSIEKSRDKNGTALPLPPTVYQSIRADQRPMLGMLFFAPEAVIDVTLRMLGICIAEAFFSTIRDEKAKSPRHLSARGFLAFIRDHDWRDFYAASLTIRIDCDSLPVLPDFFCERSDIMLLSASRSSLVGS